MPPSNQIAWVHNQIKQQGAAHPEFAGYLCQVILALKAALPTVSKASSEGKTPLRDMTWLGVLLLDFVRMSFHNFTSDEARHRTRVTEAMQQAQARGEAIDPELYNPDRSFRASYHPAYAFFSDLHDLARWIPFPAQNMWELEAAVQYVIQSPTSLPELSKENKNVEKGTSGRILPKLPLPRCMTKR